jgi:hypothetical protein
MAIKGLDHDEAWRHIPPEEKLSILSQAHSSALLSAVVYCIIGGTSAVAMQQPWLLWGALLTSPMVFQFAAGRAWRTLKPATMLRYLAARSAARRYAYAANAKDLEVSLIFRGFLDKNHGELLVRDAIESMVGQVEETEVWVALFEDALVMMSEQPGGAGLEFAYPVTDKLGIETQSKSGADYAADKEIFLSYSDKDGRQHKVKLTSDFPGALVVFEKRLRAFQSKSKEKLLATTFTAPSRSHVEEAQEENDPLDRQYGDSDLFS